MTDTVVWKSCNCGCCGMETVYKGRYFWKGHTVGGHYLFSKHAGWGYHVGEFRYSSKAKADQGVRDNYKFYARISKLTWHLCPCGRCSRMTVCFRHLRFWAKWDSFLRRVNLFRTHQGRGVRGHYTRAMIDTAVREIARKQRRELRARH